MHYSRRSRRSAFRPDRPRMPAYVAVAPDGETKIGAAVKLGIVVVVVAAAAVPPPSADSVVAASAAAVAAAASASSILATTDCAAY